MKAQHTVRYLCVGLCLAVHASVPANATDKYPLLADELTKGRVIWLTNCETCHAYGTAGAPNPLKPPEWKERVGKPRATLYKHAIEGFYGESDTFMPPRGGNAQLSDNEVKFAVDYMVALANFFLQKNEE